MTKAWHLWQLKITQSCDIKKNVEGSGIDDII